MRVPVWSLVARLLIRLVAVCREFMLRFMSVGRYMIIRYRGREVPVEVSVVATDPLDIYEEQVLFVPVTYDFVEDPLHQSEEVPYNGFVTADFVLQKK